MTERDEMVALADELDGWHDCADGDVPAGNGHFRLQCTSDSEQQRLNLRATLREAAKALRSAARTDADVATDCFSILKAIDHTLSVHGHLDAGTPLHERVEIAIETIAALPAPGGNATGWQPIETAPKGKGLIDVWTVGWGAEPHRVADCYYDSICDEWRTSRPTGQLICVKARYVTHWQPLPPPPTITRKSQSEERS